MRLIQTRRKCAEAVRGPRDGYRERAAWERREAGVRPARAGIGYPTGPQPLSPGPPRRDRSTRLGPGIPPREGTTGRLSVARPCAGWNRPARSPRLPPVPTADRNNTTPCGIEVHNRNSDRVRPDRGLDGKHRPPGRRSRSSRTQTPPSHPGTGVGAFDRFRANHPTRKTAPRQPRHATNDASVNHPESRRIRQRAARDFIPFKVFGTFQKNRPPHSTLDQSDWQNAPGNW